MSDTSHAPHRFELGLVMAGAVSAGAYTAGVLDFLIQALDEWQAAKDQGRSDTPPHEARLRALTGASAGGITAGLAAGQLYQRFEHMTTHPSQGGRNNKLFESWVDRIDIGPLLGDRDLRRGEAPVVSLLDSTILDEIGAGAFRYLPSETPPHRPYLADPLHVLVTLTNLRGVPYSIGFQGIVNRDYGMLLHADHMHFAVSPQGNGASGATTLVPGRFEDPGWATLRQASLATGAFPLGLAPRALRRGAIDYRDRFAPVEPAWPAAIARTIARDGDYPYDFLCVDGGVIDNEPLELTRTRLFHEEREAVFRALRPSLVSHAILLIDPFPNMADFSEADDGHEVLELFDVARRSFAGLINQARFKAEELQAALDEDRYDRFMIAPRRTLPGRDAPEAYAIASGGINGFGGFLSRAFREHDYQLGRRNAQRFLRSHLVLPSEGDGRNHLFDAWPEELKRDPRFLVVKSRADGRILPPGQPPGPEDVAMLPIIPLVGAAAEPIGQPPAWPSYPRSELDRLRGRIRERAQGVVQRVIDRNVKNWFTRRLLSNAWWIQRGRIVDTIMERIERDLSNRELLS